MSMYFSQFSACQSNIIYWLMREYFAKITSSYVILYFQLLSEKLIYQIFFQICRQDFNYSIADASQIYIYIWEKSKFVFNRTFNWSERMEFITRVITLHKYLFS